MTEFQHALILLLLIASLSVVGRWLPWPPYQLFARRRGCGARAAFPQLKLDPGFLLCFLPPLLFADGWLMPTCEFVRARAGRFSRSRSGSWFFTTVAVGLRRVLARAGTAARAGVRHSAPSPFRRRMRVRGQRRHRKTARACAAHDDSQRQSLRNDATGLVGFKFASRPSSPEVSRSCRSLVSSRCSRSVVSRSDSSSVRRRQAARSPNHMHSSDPFIEITCSMMTPYAGISAAEELQRLGRARCRSRRGLYSGLARSRAHGC